MTGMSLQDLYDPGPVPEQTVPMPERLDLDTELTEEQQAHWRIESDGEASWALRKLAALRAADARDEATAQGVMNNTVAWLQRLKRTRERDIAFFRGHLEDYGRRERAKGRKSVDVPFGVVRTREAKGRVQIADRDVFWEWVHAEERGDMVRVKEEPNLTALGDYLKETGELPPGCVMGEDSVSVSIETGEVVEEGTDA